MARMVGDTVRRAVLETDIQFDGVDYKELGKYVAVNFSTWEISQAGLILRVPVHAKHHGAKPDFRLSALVTRRYLRLAALGTKYT